MLLILSVLAYSVVDFGSDVAQFGSDFATLSASFVDLIASFNYTMTSFLTTYLIRIPVNAILGFVIQLLDMFVSSPEIITKFPFLENFLSKRSLKKCPLF